MPDDEVHLHVRMPKTRRDRLDELAAAMGEDRSAAVNRIIETELRRYAGMAEGRTVVVQRTPRMRAMRPVRLCDHPPEARSEKDPSGESRCLSCGAIVRPLR